MNQADEHYDSDYSRSVQRALAILECFTPKRPVLGIAEIARMVDLRRPTVHRYVSSHVHGGFLERTSDHRYRLTLAATQLGLSAMSSTSLEDHSRAYVEDLRWRTGCTVSVAELDGSDILYVTRVTAPRPGYIRRESDWPRRIPAYYTALGTMLLSHVPEPTRCDLIVETQLLRRGPNSITNKQELATALRWARTKEFTVSNEMEAASVIAMAAPIRDSTREVVAAISMTAHAPTTTLEKLISMSPHLLATADNISARLGLRREDDGETLS